MAAAVDEMVAPAAGGVEAALLGLVMLLGISIAEVVGDEEVRVAKGWPLVCVLVVVAMVVVVVQWTKFLGMLRNYPMQMKRHGMFILTQGSLAPVLAEARDSRFRREMFVMVCLLNVHLTSAKVFALICKRMHKTVDSRWHWRNYCCCLAFSVLVIGIGLGFENQARDQILTVVGSIFAGFNFFEVYWMDTNR